MAGKKGSKKKKTKKEELGEGQPTEKSEDEKATKEEKSEQKEMKKSTVEIETIKEEDAIEKEDEYAIEMLGWATSGYDTTKLEDMIKGKSKKKFEKEFKKVKKNIEKLNKLKEELEELNISGVEKEVDELLKVLNDPYQVKEAEKQFDKIKKMIYVKDLESELDSMMSVEELKERIEEIKARLKNIDEVEKIEDDIKDLRREFKESYALAEFVEMIDERPRAVKKIKVTEEEQKSKHPMEINDIFVFSANGKFLGHKTARKGKIDKKNLMEKLNLVKNLVKNDRFSPGVLIKVPKEGKILLIQKGKLVAIGMMVSGDVHRLIGKLLKKGIGMIEKEDEDAIKNWDGSKSSLIHLQKNMNAIMYAAMKLGKEMKEK